MTLSLIPALTRSQVERVHERSLDMLEIAPAEASELLATHQPPPLPSGAKAEINKIMARAEKVLAL